MSATGTEPLAIIHNYADLVDAMRTARTYRDLSNELCDERCGLTRGYVDKVLGPTEAKRLSAMMFDTLTSFFAVKFIMVRDLEAEEVMRPKWEGRDMSNVRSGEHRVGKYVLKRARQHLLQDFGAKLALAFGDDIEQMVAGITATRTASTIEATTPPLALPAPESPISNVEAFKPRQEEPVFRAHLRVVQPRDKGARCGGIS